MTDKTITHEQLDAEAACWDASSHRSQYLRRAAFTIRQMESDAALGALVRRIREHPMANGVALRVSPKRGADYPFDDFWRLNEAGLSGAIAALDSLLPKEPEVVTGPSGWKYKRGSGNSEILAMISDKSGWTTGKGIPVEDAPVVAALMEVPRGD